MRMHIQGGPKIVVTTELGYNAYDVSTPSSIVLFY